MNTSSIFLRLFGVAIILVLADGTRAAVWNGFLDVSTNLLTQNFSFTGTTNPAAGDSNENYYDGDMGDFDGDGWHDRALIARYGILLNTGGGIMSPVANTIVGGTYRFGDKDGVGNDATQWVDVDNDGDLDILQGGNGETLTLQINSGLGRFTTKPIPTSSALNIVNIDIDRDGDVDLAVAHAFCSDVACGHGCPDTNCAVGTWPKQFALYLNDGTGTFANVTTARGFPNNFGTNLIVGLVAGDVDADGDFDLMMINGIHRGITLARNNGGGFFTTNTIPFAVALAPIRPIGHGFSQAMNLGDIDDDGDLDLVIALVRDTAGTSNPRVGHAVFINDGVGNFTDQTATRFDATQATNSFLSGDNGKLMDIDYDGDLDFFAFDFKDNKHLQVYLNNGAGSFSYSSNHSRFFIGGASSSGTGSDTDVTDINRDGSYDVWVGAAGQNVRILQNTYQSPDGRPANMPRNLSVLAATNGGIALSWQHPAYADIARWYKVSRSTAPQMAPTDRKVIKRIGISRHQDEGFAAPITRFTTTAYLNDPDVTLIGTNNEVQFIDRTAIPGVTYFYAVAHMGTENIESVPTPEVAATILATNGPDTTPPQLTIVSPVQQDWTAYARIVLDYADGGSGIDPASLRVSFNRQLGTNGAPGVRAADADISDIFFRRDTNAFVSALQPPLSLSNNTLVTLKASIADKAGNSATQTVQFFVSVIAPQLPTAAIANTTTNGLAPLAVPLSGAGSSDGDGKVLRWEWYFGDGTTALGRNVTKTYTRGGTYNVTLLVRDTHGGVSTASRSVTVSGFAILSASASGTNFSLSFPTASNRNYTVEQTASLPATNWSTLTTVTGNGSLRTVVQTNAANPQQFFRIRAD